MFVLVGQVLNARGRFGPMMWAPIANNVISVGVLLVYLLGFGAARGDGLCGGFSTGQEALLGIGSTLGIVAQFLILRAVPAGRRLPLPAALRLPRHRPRPHPAAGHLDGAFVVVNQVAYTVVVRLASSGTARPPERAGPAARPAAPATPSTRDAFLFMMVPHSIVTVSLATAILPRLSRLRRGRRPRRGGAARSPRPPGPRWR